MYETAIHCLLNFRFLTGRKKEDFDIMRKENTCMNFVHVKLVVAIGTANNRCVVNGAQGMVQLVQKMKCQISLFEKNVLS